jgi:hypothetical protein
VTDKTCTSCGRPADLEIEPQFRPLTVRGERACALVEKYGPKQIVNSCVNCLLKVGDAIERGEFAEEEP